MIFVTVGVQLPFDRLVGAVDTWAGTRDRSDVVAQIGASKYVPKHIRCQATMTPTEFKRCVTEATAVVAHAGMGSIITALELGKPILIMPRRAALGEHRNDHQMSTARLMAEQNIVTVAQDEDELVDYLDRIETLGRSAGISSHAGSQLVGRISAFIAEIDRRR
jgi:UDP-N-acetylglucosamine transferase subunit ALG13